MTREEVLKQLISFSTLSIRERIDSIHDEKQLESIYNKISQALQMTGFKGRWHLEGKLKEGK